MNNSSQINKHEEMDYIDGALFSRIPSKQCDINQPSSKSAGKDNVDGALFSRVPSKHCDIDQSSSKCAGIDNVHGALFSRIPSKQCDIDQPSSKAAGRDNVDGVLFSRIPSKQCDIDQPSSKSAGRDNVDGALFSRIPSKQCDIDQPSPKSSRKDNEDDALFLRMGSKKNTSGVVNSQREPRYNEKIDDKITLECTIRPEDLSDDDVIDPISNSKDPSMRNENNDIIGEKISESSSSSFSPSDQSDGIQGSRVTLQELDDEQEIVAHHSSTFYTQPPFDDNLERMSGNNNFENNEVLFYVEGTEGDIAQASELNNAGQNEIGICENESSLELIKKSPLNENKSTKFLNEDTGLSAIDIQARDDLDSPHEIKERLCCDCTCWNLTKALIFPIASLLVYFWDIGSDIRLAVSYRENGDVDLFWITLACILIPHILMAIVDVSWVWLDRGRANRCRIILGSLTLGRVVRALNYIRHIFKIKLIPKTGMMTRDVSKRSWHKARAREEKRDCFLLDFINAFMESAPQLFVQLYLYYAYDLELTFIRVINLLSSWISIAWTYAAYYRTNREVLAGKQDVKFLGFTIFFCSVLSVLAARFICTALFLVNYYTWIGGLCIFVHFCFMFFWITLKERPKLEGTISESWFCGRLLYYVFFAYVSIFCFMNLNDTKARKRMAVFYIVIYVENSLMAIFSFLKITENEIRTYQAEHLLVLPVGLILHVILLLIYYLFLHPKRLCHACKFPCGDTRK